MLILDQQLQIPNEQREYQQFCTIQCLSTNIKSLNCSSNISQILELQSFYHQAAAVHHQELRFTTLKPALHALQRAPTTHNELSYEWTSYIYHYTTIPSPREVNVLAYYLPQFARLPYQKPMLVSPTTETNIHRALQRRSHPTYHPTLYHQIHLSNDHPTPLL